MNRILFVGNASYQNRGCEAIVRGTVNILDATINSCSYSNGFYGDAHSLRSQQSIDEQRRIKHVLLQAYPHKWSRAWLEQRLNERFGTDFPSVHARLKSYIANSLCALEIGGDNYTLDYGFPQHLIAMDKWLQKRGLPVVTWGASIGPFDNKPEDERAMMEHLRSLTGVFVRESATFSYLTETHNLSNVHLFADPAFTMEPQEPGLEDVKRLVSDAPVAINISPLLAAYRGVKRMPWEVSRADLQGWILETAAMVLQVHKALSLPIVLLGHVGSSSPGIDDYQFLEAVHQECRHRASEDSIRIIRHQLNARELKWLISCCRMLVGARTHATIAAFSSCIPTVSLGYSRKAIGINQDVFDTTDYCIKSSDLTPEKLVDVVERTLHNESPIREHLRKRIPGLKASAMAAGPALVELLGRTNRE